MAGIGFELRKVIDNSYGLLHSTKSYAVAAITINGPMFLCIIAVNIARLILGNRLYSGIPIDSILITVTYTFVVASIITGSYSLTLTRYISDCIYNKKYIKVFPSLLGAIIPALLISIIASLCMVLWGGLDNEYIIPILTLLSLVCVVWLEMIYLSAIRNYEIITKAFFIGNILGIIFLLLIRLIEERWKIHYIFFSFNAGFTATASLLIYQISMSFGNSLKGSMEWLSYFKKIPSLFMTGLFYSLGLYFLCVYYRFSREQIFINGFIIPKPEFDIPFFWAAVGIIPGMAYFSVKFETSLYTNCVELFSKINNNGIASEISYCIQKLITEIRYYSIKFLLIQVSISLFMMIVPLMLVQVNEAIFVFWMLTVGLSATLLMYAAMLVMLYFDKKDYPCIISLIYMSLAISLTLFLDNFGAGLIGLGFMIAALISMILSVILLIIFISNLKDYVFIMKNKM